VKCEHCGGSPEAGLLLVASRVLWHTKPSFFFEAPPAFPCATAGKGDYYFFPFQLPAMRCHACGWLYVEGPAACEHEREAGFLFPRGALRWWHRPEPFQPSLWFVFSGRSRGGNGTEVVAGGGMITSVVNSRVEAGRCSRCGSIAFRGRSAVTQWQRGDRP
jgi:hypothetical protein